MKPTLALPEPSFCLYHWSPTRNRTAIRRHGLRVGMKAVDRNWRPPYVAFSDNPALAWTLSGAIWPQIGGWDLWMVDTGRHPTGREAILEMCPDTRKHYVKEWRIYETIPKGAVEYIASRGT